MKNMNAFEKWQVGVLIIQTAVMLAAFLAAYYIGLKQNEINKNLLELNYEPSLYLSYQSPEIIGENNPEIKLMGLQLKNNGKTRITLRAYYLHILNRKELTDKDIYNLKFMYDGRGVIPSGQSSNLVGEDIFIQVRPNLDEKENGLFYLYMFFETANHVKYQAQVPIRISLEKNQEIIAIEPMTYKEFNWLKFKI